MMTRNCWNVLFGGAIVGSVAMGACSAEQENNDSSPTGGVSATGGASANGTESNSVGGFRSTTTRKATGGSNFFDNLTFPTSTGGRSSTTSTAGEVGGEGGEGGVAGETARGGATGTGGGSTTGGKSGTGGTTTIGTSTGTGGTTTIGTSTGIGGTTTIGTSTGIGGGTAISQCGLGVFADPNGVVSCSEPCASTVTAGGQSITYNCACTSGKYVCKDGTTDQNACPTTVFTAPSSATCKPATDTTCSLTGTSVSLGNVKYGCTCAVSGIWSCVQVFS